MRDRIAHVLGRAALLLSSLLLAADLVLLSYGVASRYLLGSSPFWMAELARFLMIGTALLAAGAVWTEGLHMRVAVIERVVPGPLAAVLHWYQWLLTLALAAFATWASWGYAWSVEGFQTMGLGVSRTLPLLVLPVGFALLFLHALLRGPKPLPEGDVEGVPADYQSAEHESLETRP